MRRVHCATLLFFLALAVAGAEVRAATVTWVAPGSGNWSTGLNWNTGTAPASGDNVVIAGTGTFTVTLDVNATIGNLTLGGASGLQTLALGSTLTLNGTATVEPTGILRITGTLVGGTVNVAGALNFNSGTMKNGVTSVSTGGTLTFGESVIKVLDAHTLNNSSSATFSGIGRLIFTNNAVFNNLAGGVLDLQTNSSFDSSGTGGTFNNAGTVRRTVTTGVFAVNNLVAFNNSGTVEVQTGTLQLNGGGTQSGAFAVSAGAALTFYSGSFTLNAGTSFTGAGQVNLAGTGPVVTIATGATVNAQNITHSAGTLQGGTFNVQGVLTFNGGTMKNGVTTLGAGSTMTLGGSGGKGLDGHTLNNSGTATFSGTGWLSFLNSGMFNNLAGGVLELQTNGLFTYSGTGGTFNNAGTVRRLLATGDFAVDVLVSFNNSGTVEVHSGTLELRGGGTQSGAFAISSGAALEFNSGNYTLNGGTSFTGAGMVNLTSGGPVLTIPAGTTVSAQNLQLMGGDLEGGTLNVNGTLAFNCGTMKNGLTRVVAGGTLTFGDTCDKVLDGHTLSNAGLASYNAFLTILPLTNNAVLRNEAGGVLELRADGSFRDGGTTGGTVNNEGTLRRLVEFGHTNIFTVRPLVTFNNSGTVEIREGRLQLASVYTQTAGSTRLTGGRLESTLSRPDAFDIRGGTLEGIGTITGNVTLGGVLKPGMAGSPSATGILTINGNYTQTATGRIDVELGGVLPGNQFDQVNVSGAAALAGTLNAQLVNSFYPATGDGFRALTFTSRSGGFTNLTGLNIGGDDALLPYYYPNSLDLLMNIFPAELSLTGSVSPDPVIAGANITYSMSAANAGPLAATGVTVTGDIPPGTTFVSATPSQGTCSGTTSITCNFGSLNVGATTTATVVVRTSQVGPVTNTFRAQSNETDRVEADNYLTLFTTVIESASDPYITGLSPGELITGAVRTVVVSGQNFPTAGATVKLQRGARRTPDDPPDLTGRVISATSSRIETEFNLTSGEYLAEWDVVVSTASRPLWIQPLLILPASERSGVLRFPIGFRRANYLDLYNAGNDDGVILLEIEPPHPGVIELQIASPTGAMVWDSTTQADPSIATLLVDIKKHQLVSLTTSWRVPPESVLFPAAEGAVQSQGSTASLRNALRTDGFSPIIEFNRDQQLIWNHTMGVSHTFLNEIFYRALRTPCGQLRRKLQTRFPEGSAQKFILDEYINMGLTRAIAEGVFTPDGVFRKIADVFAEYGQTSFPGNEADREIAATIRSCLDQLHHRFRPAIADRIKQSTDYYRARNPSFPAPNRPAALQSLESLRASLTSEGEKFAEQLRRPGGFIDQIQYEECNPAPKSAHSSQEQIGAAWDPNDKTVNSPVPCQAEPPPSTQCIQYYVAPGEPIEFLIQFENKKEATEAATFVVITDVFDSNLDLNTLEVLSTSHPDKFSMQTSGRTVVFRFDDIQLGPNVNPPEGEGYIRLRVRPVSGLQLNTVIQNQASIVFDFNPAILTPLISILLTDDVDRDGVIDLMEDRAPGGGDGNADGTPDRQQAHVTSLTVGGQTVTLVTGGGCNQNQLVAGAAEGGQTKLDSLFDYTRGLLTFVLPCTTAEVTVIHHGLATLGNGAYRFFAPTNLSDPSSVDWMAPAAITSGTTTVGGATAATVTFTLNDFDLGDQTDADGRIVHTGGLGSPSSVVEFSLDGLVIFEPRGTATVTVTRSGNATGAASVAYSTSDGSATADDYLPASGTLSWADGDLAPKTFSVAITSDATREPEETIDLRLTNPTGGAGLGDVRAIELTITDRLIGDANGDRSLSVADVIYLVNFLFAAGAAPLDISDVNADGETGVADVFYLVNHFFAGGLAPE